MTKDAIQKHLEELLKQRKILDEKILALRNALNKKGKSESMTSLEELKEIIDYNQHTGIFTLKRYSGGKTMAGNRIGYLSRDGYRRIRIKNLFFLEHRLAWWFATGKPAEYIIDHINGHKDDNRFSNLKHVTWAGNNINNGLRSDNTSGQKGVSLHKSGRWRASLCCDGRQVYHKLFATKEEAATAYRSAFEKWHGFLPDLGKTQNVSHKTVENTKA